eukprot:RCo024370
MYQPMGRELGQVEVSSIRRSSCPALTSTSSSSASASASASGSGAGVGVGPHVVTFVEKEAELSCHELPRWAKLKRADEHHPTTPSLTHREAVGPMDVQLTLENVADTDGTSPLREVCGSSPHVAFDVPEDILHPHERSRSSQLKLADELFIAPEEAPGSPHVVFVEPEKVLREHESSRLPMFKKGDERVLRREGGTGPYTVEVAPYRVLFNTPEDLLRAHESPRSPALKLADEAYVWMTARRLSDIPSTEGEGLPPSGAAGLGEPSSSSA